MFVIRLAGVMAHDGCPEIEIEGKLWLFWAEEHRLAVVQDMARAMHFATTDEAHAMAQRKVLAHLVLRVEPCVEPCGESTLPPD
jgi:hypothetical protein